MDAGIIYYFALLYFEIIISGIGAELDEIIMCNILC